MGFSVFVALDFAVEAIIIGAFLYGVFEIMLKKGASYFKFLVCAVGCYGIADLLRLTYYFCYGEQASVTSMFSVGYFGCFLFLYSACRGPFDSIIDDRSKSLRKYRIIPLFAPVLVCVATFAAYIPVSEKLSSKQYAVIFLMNVPKFAASYFNVKHLIFPDMGYGFIKAVRPCNIFALSVYLCDIVYTYTATVGSRIAVLICGVVTGICFICLMISAKRGIEKWKV